MFLKLFHIQFPFASPLDAQNAASFLTAVPGARAAWEQKATEHSEVGLPTGLAAALGAHAARGGLKLLQKEEHARL